MSDAIYEGDPDRLTFYGATSLEARRRALRFQSENLDYVLSGIAFGTYNVGRPSLLCEYHITIQIAPYRATGPDVTVSGTRRLLVERAAVLLNLPAEEATVVEHAGGEDADESSTTDEANTLSYPEAYGACHAATCAVPVSAELHIMWTSEKQSSYTITYDNGYVEFTSDYALPRTGPDVLRRAAHIMAWGFARRKPANDRPAATLLWADGEERWSVEDEVSEENCSADNAKELPGADPVEAQAAVASVELHLTAHPPSSCSYKVAYASGNGLWNSACRYPAHEAMVNVARLLGLRFARREPVNDRPAATILWARDMEGTNGAE
jgi:hypothetical protein